MFFRKETYDNASFFYVPSNVNFSFTRIILNKISKQKLILEALLECAKYWNRFFGENNVKISWWYFKLMIFLERCEYVVEFYCSWYCDNDVIKILLNIQIVLFDWRIFENVSFTFKTYQEIFIWRKFINQSIFMAKYNIGNWF